MYNYQFVKLVCVIISYFHLVEIDAEDVVGRVPAAPACRREGVLLVLLCFCYYHYYYYYHYHFYHYHYYHYY